MRIGGGLSNIIRSYRVDGDGQPNLKTSLVTGRMNGASSEKETKGQTETGSGASPVNDIATRSTK